MEIRPFNVPDYFREGCRIYVRIILGGGVIYVVDSVVYCLLYCLVFYEFE